jgi:LysM repeat protein
VASERRKSTFRRRAVHSSVIPSPPSRCNGFLHTVQPRDSLYSIAKKYGCSMPKLLAANPQLSRGARSVFVRQIICIPEFRVLPIIDPLAPRVLFVEFFGPFGETLPVQNGSVLLAARTFIRIIFSSPVTQVFFFLAQAGTTFFQPAQLIGIETVVPRQRTVRFTWDVPAGTRGTLFIIGCNEFVCGPAEEILVRPR